jgi:predicted TIM-barrel fold metal-dependent hydrolase
MSALHRYPNLKISLAESGIGWVPYFLERADYTLHQHNAWVNNDWHGKLPSQVFREHFLACFIDDKFGCKNFADVGADNIAYECDYPHSDTTWPDVAERLWENFDGLSDGLIDKITHRNALEFFNFDPFAILGRENCTVEALRATAKGVDTSVRSVAAGRKLGREGHAVTSGEVLAQFG